MVLLIRECEEENWGRGTLLSSSRYAVSSGSLKGGGDSRRGQCEVGVGSLWRWKLSLGAAALWPEVHRELLGGCVGGGYLWR